jgi:GNAT superfamily N-acetyltransferase
MGGTAETGSAERHDALDLGAGFCLRPALFSDHAALCRVCLATGDAGQDASAREDDPELLGMVFAVPYAVLTPDFSYVIAGPGDVCGYLLGTPSSASFYERYEREWLPPLQSRVTDPGEVESRWRGSDWVRRLVHRPPTLYPPALHAFPAHAHIDLLPEARGRGIGRACMRFLCERFAAAGASGVHLHVNPRNEGAQNFYRSLGFAVLDDASLPAGTTFMARHLP